jgi:putative hydrolase
MVSRLNVEIAEKLEEAASLLASQGANPFRVRAYRRGAEAVRRLSVPASDILAARGVDGLRELPGIGDSLARAIRDLVRLGRLPMLDRLRGEMDPVKILSSVPGIGFRLADRLHHELGIDTLEELETAAHDGRLEEIAGFGAKRLAGIRDSLAHRLARVRPWAPIDPAAKPPVSELLDVDREYRTRARAGTLPLIAPRRFNPTGERWLPILHTTRSGRHYTALFSNTARAHRLGRTRDWVVIYGDGERGEMQATVVTATHGPLRGSRVVRGREAECESRLPVSA